MKVYIVGETKDKRGQLTHVVQCLKGLPISLKIFLAEQSHIIMEATTSDVDESVKRHFSIEEVHHGSKRDS